MFKTFNTLFLHIYSLLLYELNTVTFLNNLIHDNSLNGMSYRMCQKNSKKKTYTTSMFIKKIMLNFFNKLFLHTYSSLLYQLNSEFFLNKFNSRHF